MADHKYIIRSSCCAEYFYHAIRNVTYISVAPKRFHAEEKENRAISSLLLKGDSNPRPKALVA